MDESVYRVTELIGVSSESWEAAARNAIETAARTLRDLRIAEAHRFDVTIEDGKVKSYGVRLDVSFKYGPDVTGLRADVAMSGSTPVASSHFLYRIYVHSPPQRVRRCSRPSGPANRYPNGFV